MERCGAVHDQDPTLRRAQHAAGDAAKERAGDRAAARRSNDDHVDVVLLGVADNLRDGRTAKQGSPGRDAVCTSNVGRFLERAVVASGGLVQDPDAHVTDRDDWRQIDGRDDVDEVHL
jgi:hypothetical protein